MSTEHASAHTILVVDDDPDITYLLALALRDVGYQVQQETSAAGLEERLCTDGAIPDLLLLDIKLGEQDAVPLVQRLRTQPRTAALPVLLISARADVGVAAALCGARGLAKPFSMADLRAAVLALLPPAEPPVEPSP
jgi:DNA-binding response OmpR family regulator